VRIKARSILTHTNPTHPYRGFGIPHVGFARESAMNEAADALGIDPLELRLMNLVAHGEEHVPGDTPADGDWRQTVQKAAEAIGWDTPVPEGRGRGIAVGVKSGPTTGLSYSIVRLLVDGSALVYSGTSDMGQGARTIFAQIAANELGLPIERVSVVMGDTFMVPYDQQTSASRSSVLMGNAILFACRDIQEQVRKMAARVHDVDEDEIVVDEGVVQLPDAKMPIIDVVQEGLGRLGGELIGTGEMRKEAYPEHPLGGTAAFFEFNCTAVELEVDEGTGEIVVHHHVTVGDVGLSLNPTQVRGQDDGAAVMGLGHAFMEHIIRDPSGRFRNDGAIDYRIPTSMDLPLSLESHAIENRDGPGPYGVKGISEGSLLVVAPAVTAAIKDAVGVTIRDLPCSPERVWRAMREQES
jgi:CO/xanthine dehydrogenase Mo-binding subunit